VVPDRGSRSDHRRYESPGQLIEELEELQACLVADRLPRVAYGEGSGPPLAGRDLRLHLASLELRPARVGRPGGHHSGNGRGASGRAVLRAPGGSLGPGLYEAEVVAGATRAVATCMVTWARTKSCSSRASGGGDAGLGRYTDESGQVRRQPGRPPGACYRQGESAPLCVQVSPGRGWGRQ